MAKSFSYESSRCARTHALIQSSALTHAIIQSPFSFPNCNCRKLDLEIHHGTGGQCAGSTREGSGNDGNTRMATRNLRASSLSLTAASLASTDEVVNASNLSEPHRGLSYEALGSGYRVQG